jgi:hypothetical protein
MRTNLTALERAFDLASSGKCLSVMDIALSLRAEGYSATQLEGPALKKQLVELIAKSTKFMPKGSQGAKRPNKAKGADIQAGRTAKGEAANKPNKAPSRAKGGKAGGSAKVKSKDSPRRKEITKLAAKARWEG